MNVEPVDLGDEIRQGLKFCLAFAPVIVCRPIFRESLCRCELHALGRVVDGFLFGPTSSLNPAAKVDQLCFGYVDMEGTDSIGFGSIDCCLWLCHSRTP